MYLLLTTIQRLIVAFAWAATQHSSIMVAPSPRQYAANDLIGDLLGESVDCALRMSPRL